MSVINNLSAASNNAIRDIVIGENTITVGPAGYVSNLADAITLRNTLTHTLLASIVASVTGTTSGTVSVCKATKNSGDDLTSYVGQEVYVQIDSAGPLIKMFVISTTELRSKYSFYSDLSSVSFDLYRINPAAIALLPGYREELSGTYVIPSFTTIGAVIPGTASLYTSGTGYLNYSNTNEVRFAGITINQKQSGTGYSIAAINTNLKSAMCDQLEISKCVCDFGPQDGLYCDAKSGTITITESMILGIWDSILLGMPARTFIANNPLIGCTTVDGSSDTSIGIHIAGAGVSAYPDRVLKITNNKIDAINFASSPLSTTGIDINTNVAFKLAQIDNNMIRYRSYGGNVAPIGINLANGGVFDVSGNLLDGYNVGAATPIDFKCGATTGVTLKTDGANRKVGDVAFNNSDPLGRISTYTNLG